MKRIIYILSLVACHLSLYGQSISFPAPEMRVDTIKPLNGYGVTFMRPTTFVNKILIKGNRVPPTFYIHAVDSLGNTRFGLTKNGMLISGTHHDPQVNVDGLALIGRYNALKGADAMAIGKRVVNLADSTMAYGGNFTVDENRFNAAIFGWGANRFETDATDAKIIGNRITVGNLSNYADNSVAVGIAYTMAQLSPNTVAIGYGSNRIEFDSNGGRFLGNWTFPAGIPEAPQDGQIYGRKNAGWIPVSGSGGPESDPVWTAASTNFYTKTNMLTSGGSQMHWDNITNKPIVGTVTSVGISLPNIFSVSGSPVTGVGVLSASLTSQTQATVFAAPTTGNGTPAFRALTETDIPALNWTKITSRPTTLAGYGITDAYTQAQLSTPGGSSVHWNNVTNKVNAARSVAGLISLPSGTTSNRYLDETGAWTVPPTASGGITSVATTNSGTVTFSGAGTSASPLSATAAVIEADPTVPANVKAITSTNITNWNTAFTNNHTHANKAVLDGIASTNVTNWNTAFGWGNHATAGYLSTETDPTVPAHVKSITTTNIATWNAPAWTSISGKPTFATVATSGSYNDLSNRPTIPAAQVNADWNAAAGVALILNKPTIPAAYTLPAATASTLGGVKIGSGLSVTADGTLSSSGGGSYTLPVATTSVLGGVKADGNVSITASGTMIPRKLVSTDVELSASSDRLTILNTSGVNTSGLEFRLDGIYAVPDASSGDSFTIPMRIYRSTAEPDIPNNSFAFWVSGGVNFWLILDSNGTQKKIQLQ